MFKQLAIEFGPTVAYEITHLYELYDYYDSSEREKDETVPIAKKETTISESDSVIPLKGPESNNKTNETAKPSTDMLTQEEDEYVCVNCGNKLQRGIYNLT